jgi:4-hydroxy-2-oxoheptanedioate aldolase
MLDWWGNHLRMDRQNKLKKKLKEGGRVFGTWSMLSSPSVMNVIGEAGLDFVIIDMEHGPMSVETAEYQIYATEAAGASAIVRLGEINENLILRVLDMGSLSVLMSHVATVEDASRVVAAAKYFPDGTRGLSPFTRNHGYSDERIAEKMQYANEQVFVGVLVEGEEGLANLDGIARVKGLDMIYLGIYDLSQSLGIPGQLRHPKLLKHLEDCVQIIEANGLAAGSVAPDYDYLKKLFDAGFRFLSYRVDCAILREGFVSAREVYERLLAGVQE